MLFRSVINITYDEDILRDEGSYIIEDVHIQGSINSFHTGCLGAREYIGEWLWKKENPTFRQLMGHK